MDGMETDVFAATGLDVGDALLLDTSAIVAYLEGSAGAKAAMNAVIEAGGSGMLKLRASALVWTEALRQPPSAEAALAYRRLLADSTRIVIVPVDVAIAYAAAGMLAALDRRSGQGQVGMRPEHARESGATPFFADAIHLATAVVGRCKAVLTNDEAWKKAAPANLRVIILDELAAVFSL